MSFSVLADGQIEDILLTRLYTKYIVGISDIRSRHLRERDV